VAQTLALTAFVLAPATPAAAAGPAISVSKGEPVRILAGENARYSITVTNSGDAPIEYNASISDVLPPGATYLGGVEPASAGEPRSSTDPVSGRTVLLWENLTDLPRGGSYTLSFDVDPGPPGDLVGSVVINNAFGAASTDERDIPDFDASGRPVPGPATQSGLDDLPTQVTALEIRKSNDNAPEGELLRGVHDQRSTYTLEVENNTAAATNGVVLIDYLPAGLEFLACGNIDNSPQGTREYPGAPPLGAPPLGPSPCPAPVSVETVTNPSDPSQTLPAGVYTKVTWNLGTLAPGQTATVRYVAAIPLRANRADFPGGAPTPQSLRQGANLDNNIGGSTQETPTERSLRNFASATGTYTGPLAPGAIAAASATTSNTVTVEDLRLRKTLSPTSPTINEVVTYSLTMDTSEYMSASGIVLVDELPDGMCPIAPGNPSGDPACAGRPGGPSVDFASVVPNTTTGGWTLTFDPVDIDRRNSTLTVTFPAVFKDRYNDHGPRAGRPTVGADSFTNTVSLTGTSEPAVQSTDLPLPVTDDSSASFGTARPTLSKQMKPRFVPMDCDPAVGEPYADSPTLTPTQRAFRQDDIICFKVRIEFPATIAIRNMLLTDFVPTGTRYEPGTFAYTPANQVSIQNVTTDPQIIQVILGTEQPPGSGDFFVAPGSVFEAVLGVRVLDAAPGPAPDITANLVKTRYSNSAGELFADRDFAAFAILPAPDVSVLKGVLRVDSPASGPNAANVDGSTVQQGSTATFRVDITNTPLPGLETVDYAIRGTQAWDVLPAGIGCSAISNHRVAAHGPTPNPSPVLQPLPAGIVTCFDPGTGPAVAPAYGDRATQALLVWQFPAPDAGNAFSVRPGETMTMAYDMRLPSVISVSSRYDNTVALPRFEAFTDVLNVTTPFYPADNINPQNVPLQNAERAADPSWVVTADAGITKTQTTAIEEANNNRARDAVIGEEVTYTVGVTVPAQTTVYNAVLRDPLPRTGTIQTVELLSATQSGPPGPTLDANLATDTVTLTFPPTYTNTTNAPQTFTVTIVGRVTTVAQNTNGQTRTNTATFTSNRTLGGTPLPQRQASSQLRVVEPSPTITKSPAPTEVIGGQIITYTLSASNANGRPPLHDTTTVDCLPALLTFEGVTSNTGGAVTTGPGGGGSGCPAGTTRIEWRVGTVLPGTTNTEVLRYTASVSRAVVAGTTLTNTAALTGSSLNTGSPTTTAIEREYRANTSAGVLVSGADLTKGVLPARATIGQQVEYTVTARARANVNYYEASVLDQLPVGLDPAVQLVSITCTGAGCAQIEANPGYGSALTPNGQTIGWYLGDALTSPEPRVVTITYRTTVRNLPVDASGPPNQAGALPTNTVRVWWSTDPNAPRPTTVTDPPRLPGAIGGVQVSAQFTIREPSLTIDKSVAPTSVQPGDVLGYRVAVANGSGINVSEAFAITVTDTVPLGVVVDPASISNGGELTGADPVRGGGTITWTGTDLGPLAPGESTELTYSARLAPSETLTAAPLPNTAAVREYFSLPDGNGERRRYTGPTDVAQVQPLFPRLVTEKSVAAGDEATLDTPFGWTVVVRNDGGAEALGVDIADTLPLNWCYVDGSATVQLPGAAAVPLEPAVAPIDCTAGSQPALTWTDIGALAPGQQAVVRFTAAPTQSVIDAPGVGLAVPQVNAAVATGQDRTGATGNATGPYSAGPDTAQARIRDSDLVLTKTAPVPVVPAGASGQYIVSVRNDGPDPARGPFSVVDRLPANLGLTSAIGDGWNCLTAGTVVSCTRSTPTELAPGASLPNIVFTVAVPPQTPDGQVFENIAEVRGSSLDTNPTNNTDNAFITAQRVADIRIVKTTRTTPVVPGGTITYDLVVDNLGVSAAEGPIVVSDPLPAPLFFREATGDGWSCVAAGPQVNCSSAGDLPASATLPTLTIVADVPPGALGALVNTASAVSVSTDPDLSNNSSTVTDPLVPSADLFVEKETVTDPLVAGREVTYTVRTGNLGPSVSRQPITVTDTLPAGLTFVSAGGPGWSCTPAITCTYAVDLPPNVNASDITVVALVGSDVAGTVTNPATVIGTTPDPDVTNNTDEVTDPVTGEADLAVVKRTVSPVVPGRDVTYEIAVTNTGPSTSRQPITVTDTLPAGLTFVSATGDGWACDAAIACVRASDLPAGGTAPPITVAATLDADFAGPLVNTAEVTGTTPDPVPDNNTSTVTDQPAPLADLSIVKTTTSAVVPGSDVTYSLIVANTGPSTSRGPIEVGDVLPAGLTFVSATGDGWRCDDTVACTRDADLLAGAAAPAITVTARLDPAFTGALANTATVTGTTPDPVPDNNTSTVTDPSVPSADLAITKRTVSPAVPGEEITYELVVVNNGPSVSRATITVDDPLPAGLTLVSAAGDGWTCAGGTTCTRAEDLAAGATAPTITVVALIADSATGTLANTATVTGTTPDPLPDNNSSTVTDQLTPEADLAIVKRTVTDALVPGGQVEYELLVTNNGPSDSAAPITVTDELPAALTLVSASGTGWACIAATCTRDAVLLDDEQAPPITVVATIAPNFFGDLTNTATVTGPYPDPDLDNNTATVTDPVPPLVDLVIAKEAQGSFVAGSRGTFRITVGNNGPTDDPGPITVTDTLPANARFVSADGPGWQCQGGTTVTCVRAEGLAAGASATFGLVVDVLAGPSLTNSAEVQTPSTETDLANNRDEVTVPVTTPPGPSMPDTGADVARALLLALVLLAIGGLLVGAARRVRG
jgi:uncharacterized repeat protein (TIGR01451 family)/fimbrial isopeptide formation D2 family protein